MTVLDEPRTGDPLRPATPPARAVSREVRVPRLLVTGSELSWRFLVCVAALAVVVYALTKISFAFIPFFVALMLATLLTPPALALRRRGAPPLLATTVVFAAALAAFALLVWVLAPPVVNEFGTIGDRVREGADKVGTYLADLPLGLEEREVQRQIDRADDRIRENSASITNGVVSGAQVAAQIIAGLFITLVLLFFFVKDGQRMWSWAVGLFPPSRRPMVEEMGDRSWEALGGYVRGVVCVAAVDAIGIAVALLLIGVPLVAPLAILTFFAAFVPVVGAYVAGATCALVALVAGGPLDAVLVIGATFVVQQVEGSLLYPMIVGRAMELHPVAILLAVTIGGVLAGIIGAAIAVPIAAMAAAAVAVVRKHTEGGDVAVAPAD